MSDRIDVVEGIQGQKAKASEARCSVREARLQVGHWQVLV